jgi:hypothetical protein
MRRANRPRLSLLLAVVLTLAWWPRTAAAHAEHYSQSAYLRVDVDRVTVELDLSPGSKVAGDVVAVIDENHDGEIDAAEGRAYADVVLAALALRVDGVPRALRVAETHFPPAAHLATGEDKLSLAFVTAFPALAPGPHQIQFSNRHRPVESVYLAHTFTETKSVSLGKQTRDAKNQELTADYSVAAAAALRPAIASEAGEAGGPWRRLALGIGVLAVLGAVVARSRYRAQPARIG